MTTNENMRTVVLACHGGADLALVARRTQSLTAQERGHALRALLVAGTVLRVNGRYIPRDGIERTCFRCGQQVEPARREIFKGSAVVCGGCARRA